MINLPKKKDGINMLSYTQIALWIRNKNDYIRQYFIGDKDKGDFTQYLDHGKLIENCIETEDYSKLSEQEATTLKQINRLPLFQKEVKLYFKEENLCVLGYIDNYAEDYSVIRDIKVGGHDKLVEYEKDDYIQLQIYALALEQEIGILPNQLEVLFVERGGNAFKGEQLYLTGNIHKLNLEISKEKIIFVLQRILEISEEITKYYNVFQKLNINN